MKYEKEVHELLRLAFYTPDISEDDYNKLITTFMKESNLSMEELSNFCERAIKYEYPIEKQIGYLRAVYDSILRYIKLNEIYPLTVISDRYDGSYSKAKFLAFNLDFYDLPEGIGGGDMEEFDFWNDPEVNNKYIIGKGCTPNAACFDLLDKLGV